MSLSERCAHEVLAGERERAQTYYQEGRVSLADSHETGMKATVLGSRGVCKVRLDWSRSHAGQLTAECTCPRFAEFVVCEHVWAVILAGDDRGITAGVEGEGDLEIDFELPRPDDEDEAPTATTTTTTAARRRSEAPERYTPQRRIEKRPRHRADVEVTAGWRQDFDFLRSSLAEKIGPVSLLAPPRECLALYRIDASEAVKSGSQLTVDVFYRRLQRDGGWTQPQPLHLDPEEVDKLTGEEDREIVSFLIATRQSQEGHALGTVSRSLIPAVLYPQILPRLCATGRFGWVPGRTSNPLDATPLKWDEGRPWTFRLRLDRRDERSIRLTGILERGREQRKLDEPVAILASGLVIFSDVLGPLDAGHDFPWIHLLRQKKEVVIPEHQLDPMLEQLWSLPVRPELDTPEVWRLAEVEVAPRPEVIFQPSKRDPRQLEGRVAFEYDGCIVGARHESAGVVDRERRRVLLRDRQTELKALNRLQEIGLQRPGRYQGQHDVQIAPKALPGIVVKLVEEGWAVVAEGRRLRRLKKVNMSLKTGIDWFELHANAKFDDVKIGLPDLLAAVRRGDRFVRLGDGSHGMLPEDWTKRYMPLAQLAKEDDDGVIRFMPSQTMLVDALLAAEPEVDIDQQFERLRDRLQTFEKIEPVKAPRGFRGELREYQREGLGWFRFLQDFGFGGCLADDMGLGKTVQVLALLQARRINRGVNEPTLIVVPRSVLFNWLDEAARFTPRLEVTSYHGPIRPPFEEVFEAYDVIVTTYGTMRRDILEIQEFAFDYVILDEAQAIKNPSSQSAKACRVLHADHRLALTGTPVENHLGELGSIFEFLNPGMLGRLSAFDGANPRQTDDGTLDSLAKALRPFILRRTKEQVLSELPEKTEQTIFCELESEQRRLYDELRDHYRSALKERIDEVGLGRAKIQVLEALLRLRQVACHPGLVSDDRVKDASAKTDTLLENLEEVLDEGHKALVFSQFTRLLGIVRDELDERGVTYEYLDGRTRKRQEKVERFQNDDDCKLFLISLKAGGVGLNLTAADYVFILDPWWNPAVESQAIDRAHRIGQTRPVFAYRLIARDTVEEKILDLQKDKKDLAEAILTADQSLIKNLSSDDLGFLLS